MKHMISEKVITLLALVLLYCVICVNYLHCLMRYCMFELLWSCVGLCLIALEHLKINSNPLQVLYYYCY